MIFFHECLCAETGKNGFSNHDESSQVTVINFTKLSQVEAALDGRDSRIVKTIPCKNHLDIYLNAGWVIDEN